MKVTLSFEESASSDVSIMVDALRASTTITLALNNFKRVIPCFTPEEALDLKEKIGGVLAGERSGKQIEGFELRNSPTIIKDFKTSEDTLIFTSTNGTRILENMNSKVLVGSLVNAKAVALKSIQLASEHIDVVMAGVKGQFAIEDYLAAGEILYWIRENSDDCELSEEAADAISKTRDYESLKDAFLNSRTAKRLIELDYRDDVEICCLKNISDNVAIYENNELAFSPEIMHTCGIFSSSAIRAFLISRTWASFAFISLQRSSAARPMAQMPGRFSVPGRRSFSWPPPKSTGLILAPFFTYKAPTPFGP